MTNYCPNTFFPFFATFPAFEPFLYRNVDLFIKKSLHFPSLPDPMGDQFPCSSKCADDDDDLMAGDAVGPGEMRKGGGACPFK